MDWILPAFLIASLMHMAEEYFYPGGFMDVMRRISPRFAPSVTVPAAIAINGLQLLLCVLVIVVGKNTPVFSMSVAALLSTNSVAHLAGCIRARGYVPGVITGALVYAPLSVYAYYVSISSGQLTRNGAVAAGVLGLLYQAVPLVYFESASWIRRARTGRSQPSP